MDVLKELFGTQDELHITKSLFGSGVSQGPLQIEHVSASGGPSDLSLLASSVQQSPSRDVLIPGSKTSNLIDRPESLRVQSVFPQLTVSSASRSGHGSTEDIRCVPAEMPMYLLEEDEGNDEEIIRLLSTPLENNLSQDDTQQSTTPNFVPARCEVNRVGATQSQQPNDTEANTHLQDELSNLKIHQQDDSNGTLARTQYGANAPTAQSICVSEINLLEVDANQVRELDSSINKKDPLLPFKGPSAQGNSNSQKSKESFLSGAQTESLRKSSVSVMFPWMGNLSPIGLTVTPVQVLPNLQSASPPPRKKIRHGGGWPKGKSRKPDHVPSPPPKPPSTGYGIFLSEHMASERSKFTSMSQVSKELGRLWSELTSEEKQVYHQRSDVERERYLSELRQYLSSSANSDHCLKQLNRFLSQVSATERDDNVLVCDVCNISFTSLHNKRCHYSGKMHMQTLLKNVQQKQHKLPEENYGSERTSTALSTQKLPITGDALASCLCKEAEKYTDCITELRSVDDGYQLSLQTLATLQQASAEQEFIYNEWLSMLCLLKEEWTSLLTQIKSLIHFTKLKL